MSEKDQNKLKLPFFYTFIGAVGLIGTLIFGTSELLTRGSDQWIGIIFFILIFGGLSTSILLTGQLYQVELLEYDLIQTTWLGKTKRIKWNDISFISFGQVSLELTVSNGITKIKAHSHMIGFDNLITELETKLTLKRVNLGLIEPTSMRVMKCMQILTRLKFDFIKCSMTLKINYQFLDSSKLLLSL